MHPGRLIMKIDIVYNYISDNFYFDYKAVFYFFIFFYFFYFFFLKKTYDLFRFRK